MLKRYIKSISIKQRLEWQQVAGIAAKTNYQLDAITVELANLCRFN